MTLNKIAVNKSLQAMAAQANRKIMGKQRNAAVPTFSFSPSQVLSSTTSSPNERGNIPNVVEYSEEAKRTRQIAGHTKMRVPSPAIVVENGRFVCPCCRVGFSSFEAAIGHLTDKGMKTSQCPICSKTLEAGTARNNFKAHVGRHVKQDKVCGINDCKAALTSADATKRHGEVAHPELVRRKTSFPCPEDDCEVVCSAEDALRKHLKLHKNPEATCTYCGTVVPFKDLKRHKSKECENFPKNVAICPYDGCGDEVPMMGSLDTSGRRTITLATSWTWRSSQTPSCSNPELI